MRRARSNGDSHARGDATRESAGHQFRAAWVASALLAGVLATLLAFTSPAPALAESCVPAATSATRVEDFASDIMVGADGVLTVHETIRFVAGAQPPRQFDRLLPLRYRDATGHPQAVQIGVLGVGQGGSSGQPDVTTTTDDLRIALAPAGQSLTPGAHVYTLSYWVKGALAFFSDHDTLTWPVTGVGWTVPISCATVTVMIPQAVPPTGIQASGWLGTAGGFSDAVAGTVQSNLITYTADGPLGTSRGLTISVSWPRGYMQEPLVGQSVPIVGTAPPVLVDACGLLLIAIYGALAAFWVRRPPRRRRARKSARPPPPEPPTPGSLSPAAVRYLMTTRFDERALAAAIVGLAIKGFLSIRESVSAGASAPSYQLEKHEAAFGRVRLSPEEGWILGELFGLRSTLALGPPSRPRVEAAIEQGRHYLGALYEDRFFTNNARYLIPAFIVALASVAASGAIEASRAALAGDALASWLAIALALILVIAVALGAALLIGPGDLPRQRKIFAGVIAIIVLAPLVGGFIALNLLAPTDLTMTIGLGAIAVALGLLRKLLAAPTTDGKQTRARVAAFRSIVASADARPPASMSESEPGQTDEALAYAIALDVEKEWARQATPEAFGRHGSGLAANGGDGHWYSADGLEDDTSAAVVQLSHGLCAALRAARAGSATQGAESG